MGNDVASERTATRRWRAVAYGMLFVFGLGLALVLGYGVRHFPSGAQVGTENAVGTTTPTPAWLWIVGASALCLSGTLFVATLAMSQARPSRMRDVEITSSGAAAWIVGGALIGLVLTVVA